MVRYRPTGISVWGVQWEKKDDDKEIARRVLNLLGDRRMLWKDFSLEIEEHCVQSANVVRERLGSLLDNPEVSPELEAEIKGLQSLFREFMDEVGPGDYWHRHISHYGTDQLSVALGRLRGLVGIHVGYLAARYELEVPEDLAVIVPDADGWFFDKWSLSSDGQ